MFALGDREYPGLAKLVEEAGELVQAVSRLLTAGDLDEGHLASLRLAYLHELADVTAALDFLASHRTVAERSQISARFVDQLGGLRHRYAAGLLPAHPDLHVLVEEVGGLLGVAGRLMATHGTPEHWSGADLASNYLYRLASATSAAEFAAGFASSAERARVRDRMQDKLRLFQRWHREAGGSVALTSLGDTDLVALARRSLVAVCADVGCAYSAGEAPDLLAALAHLRRTEATTSRTYQLSPGEAITGILRGPGEPRGGVATWVVASLEIPDLSFHLALGDALIDRLLAAIPRGLPVRIYRRSSAAWGTRPEYRLLPVADSPR
jgi:hypothetical protein